MTYLMEATASNDRQFHAALTASSQRHSQMHKPQQRRSSKCGAQLLLTELGPCDVLLGRGTGPNENTGNIRFREFVKEAMVSEYTLSGIDPEKVKSRIIHSVLARVKATNGRFVRKLTKEEARRCAPSIAPHKRTEDKDQKVAPIYVVVPDSEAENKARQTFRFQRQKWILTPQNKRLIKPQASASRRNLSEVSKGSSSPLHMQPNPGGRPTDQTLTKYSNRQGQPENNDPPYTSQLGSAGRATEAETLGNARASLVSLSPAPSPVESAREAIALGLSSLVAARAGADEDTTTSFSPRGTTETSSRASAATDLILNARLASNRRSLHHATALGRDTGSAVESSSFNNAARLLAQQLEDQQRRRLLDAALLEQITRTPLPQASRLLGVLNPYGLASRRQIPLTEMTSPIPRAATSALFGLTDQDRSNPDWRTIISQAEQILRDRGYQLS